MSGDNWVLLAIGSPWAIAVGALIVSGSSFIEVLLVWVVASLVAFTANARFPWVGTVVFAALTLAMVVISLWPLGRGRRSGPRAEEGRASQGEAADDDA